MLVDLQRQVPYKKEKQRQTQNEVEAEVEVMAEAPRAWRKNGRVLPSETQERVWPYWHLSSDVWAPEGMEISIPLIY